EKGGNLRYATRHCHDGLARSACHASLACASCGGPLMQAKQGAASAALVAIGLWTALWASTPPEAPAETRAARPEAVCAPAPFQLVLDVGHTAERQGATSARGVKEYVFNLRLAKGMEKALIDAGFRTTHLS